MSGGEPGRDVVVAAPVSGAAKVITITEAVMTDGLKRAADQARKSERAAQREARDAALRAQASAHAAELTRLSAAHAADREEYAAHRVRATRWFNLGVGLFLGGVTAAALTFLIMRGTLTSGADLGIDAATKTRIIEDSLRQHQDPGEYFRRPVPREERDQ